MSRIDIPELEEVTESYDSDELLSYIEDLFEYTSDMSEKEVEFIEDMYDALSCDTDLTQGQVTWINQLKERFL